MNHVLHDRWNRCLDIWWYVWLNLWVPVVEIIMSRVNLEGVLSLALCCLSVCHISILFLHSFIIKRSLRGELYTLLTLPTILSSPSLASYLSSISSFPFLLVSPHHHLLDARRLPHFSATHYIRKRAPTRQNGTRKTIFIIKNINSQGGEIWCLYSGRPCPSWRGMGPENYAIGLFT